MADTLPRSSSLDRAAPSPTINLVHTGLGALSLVALLAGAYFVQATPGHGAPAALSLLIGGALGMAFECGRFCFFCIFRDLIEHRQAGPFYAILMALAISGIGYAIVFGAFLPNPSSGRLAPDAHIGPVSPALALAGLVFGLGMALSGACISGHLYRLGEGSGYALPALGGALLGFGLGFRAWNWFYVTMIAEAPVIWLPNLIGYGGSLIAHLIVLGVIAIALLRWVAPLSEQPARAMTPAYLRAVLLSGAGIRLSPAPLSAPSVSSRIYGLNRLASPPNSAAFPALRCTTLACCLRGLTASTASPAARPKWCKPLPLTAG